jgi:hypothetical protein
MLLEKTIMDVATIDSRAFTRLKYTPQVPFAIPSLRRAVPSAAEDGRRHNERS